jgi:nicotinamide phosphoribosyltransferase
MELGKFNDKEIIIMKFAKNIVLNSDSYKYSQWIQYPEGTEYVYSYIESRGGKYDKLVFFGMQAFIREYLTTPVTAKMVLQARDIMQVHGEPFNYEGWMYIVNIHGGVLPVEIKSVDEGSVMYLKNVLVSIVNTDPKCFWLTSFLETALLRAIWYPTTVASNSYHSKEIILRALERTGDPSLIDFKLHDFGARGVSSFESAGLGGMAHLINFMGTDTVSGIMAAMEYYDAPVCGFSIPAMEHSTVTSWGRENEAAAYRNMLRHYGKQGALVAFVSDSYDIFNACDKIWGQELKQEVIDSGAVVIIRPDSGDPTSVVNQCLKILDKYFGHTVNAKGFRVLNNVRVIQGDGIDHVSINSILTVMEMNGYSADNVAFGQGGALLQQINRDTLEFAMKCSAAMIKGKWVDVYKDPITSSMKKSKRGRLMLVEEDGKFVTKPLEYGQYIQDLLKTRYVDGRICNITNFDQVRARAKELVR